MPLTQLQNNCNLSWQLSAIVAGFNPTTQGVDSINFGAGNIDLTIINNLFLAQYVLNPSDVVTIDLQDFTNLVDEHVVFTKAFSVALLVAAGAGGNVLFQPGVSNPFTWFFNGATQGINVPNGAGFNYQLPGGGPFQTVDATHKTLRLTNTGGTVCTVKIGVAGGT